MYGHIRKMLTQFVKANAGEAGILDIGGRKSHYTIGVPAAITITDLLRVTETQRNLHLGVNQSMVIEIQRRRSNVNQVLIDDMTRSALGSGTFDCAVAVEVLEHVDEDQAFVREVRRVLRPGGMFVMTTPNGDFVKNTNPDHKRHYRRSELQALLEREFDSVEVRYAIPASKYYGMALRSWSLRKPVSTFMAYIGGMINAVEDRRTVPPRDGSGMQELIAVAR